MELHAEELVEFKNFQVSKYIFESHFEDVIDVDEDYYYPDSEPMYLEKFRNKINCEPWELVSSELYEQRNYKRN